MEVKIKHQNELIDATIEMVDGVMVVTPKETIADYSQYKDGDIIVCGWEKKTIFCEWVCVLRGQIENVVSDIDIEDYCSLVLKSNTGECKLTATSGFSDAATYVRYATEEEKQKLFDALAKEGKAWDAEKKMAVDLKWHPENEEYYYCPHFTKDGEFECCWDMWEDDDVSCGIYNRGFIYPFNHEGEAKCQELCDKLNEAIKDVKP